MRRSRGRCRLSLHRRGAETPRQAEWSVGVRSKGSITRISAATVFACSFNLRCDSMARKGRWRDSGRGGRLARFRKTEARLQTADHGLRLGDWLGRRPAYLWPAHARLLTPSASRKFARLAIQATREELGKISPAAARIPRTKADQIIRRYREFGAQFFALRQLTGITADECRGTPGGNEDRSPSPRRERNSHRGRARAAAAPSGPRSASAGVIQSAIRRGQSNAAVPSSRRGAGKGRGRHRQAGSRQPLERRLRAAEEFRRTTLGAPMSRVEIRMPVSVRVPGKR